jgi:hypothetical protein
MRGPLTLFAINAPASKFTRAQLLAAQQSFGQRAWKVTPATVTFRAFPDIRDEWNRLHHDVTA